MEKTTIDEQTQILIYNRLKSYCNNPDLLHETILFILQNNLEFIFNDEETLKREFKQCLNTAKQRLRDLERDGYARRHGYLKEMKEYKE